MLKWHFNSVVFLPKYIYNSGDFVVKNPPSNAGGMGSNPGSGRSPGEGNGNPFQYSCLGNPKDRAVWWATFHRVSKSQRWLSD